MLALQPCCPKSGGCNAHHEKEVCALEVLGAGAREFEAAAAALSRWTTFEDARERDAPASEQRFRRRAYERARDQALVLLMLRGGEESSGKPGGRTRREGRHRGRRQTRGRPRRRPIHWGAPRVER